MKANERLVKFFDLQVLAWARAHQTGAVTLPARPLGDLLQHLKDFLAQEACLRQNRARTETWHIADIQFDAPRAKACILISRSDRLAADQAISDPAAQQFNVTAKVGNEGNASSAHMVVNLVPIRANTYLTTIEDSIGISSGDIAQLLSLITKSCGKADREFFMCNDASGDPALRRYSHYRYTFIGHPSQQFQNEINGGVLHGIELVDMVEGGQQFDGVPATVQQKKVTHMTVENAPGPVFDTLRGIAQAALRRNVPTFRVIFSDTADFRRTVEVDAATMRLVNEDRFVHKVKLQQFAAKLDTGYQTIHSELSLRMLALV